MHINKRILFLILTIIFAAQFSTAQNSMVSNAVQAFHNAEYGKSYELANDALANVEALSGDYVSVAFYYLAKSRIQVLREARIAKDQEKLSGMRNALIESYFDYKDALKTADAKLESDILLDLSELYNPILQTGLSALNTAYDDHQPENVRNAALKAAEGYLVAAKDISPTYLVCDLLGQTYFSKGDSLAALNLFQESIGAYKIHPPRSPDFLIAYVFYRKAIIERYKNHDNMLALSSLIDGGKLLKAEFSRLNSTGALTPEEKRIYDTGMADLVNFELDIYANDPSLSDEAIIRFQEVLQMYPEDYDKHVAYANMLESVDLNLAIDAYETAISIDGTQELAHFNLGAIYNNLGSEFYLQGLNHKDDIIADSLFHESNKYFRKAYTYMEQAYYLNPELIQSIRALVQLANSLGLEEKAAFYKQKEIELRGF
ncbi:MAG: hypothetical protein HQ565_13065 [Bacteroidetes bacterium]|nr:hypothetical protein [Bacteroidota bacterium]